VRSYRSVRRDRIRSVDIHAKLRHRLAGLRVIKIGAGQQSSAGESAVDLHAGSGAPAHAVRSQPLELRTIDDGRPADSEAAVAGESRGSIQLAGDEEVLARFRPGWVVHNIFNVWAYAMAIGLLWGANFLLPVVGIDPDEAIGAIADWEELGVVASV